MVGEKTLASILIVLLNNPSADKAKEPTAQPKVEVAAPANPGRRISRVPQFENEVSDATSRFARKRPMGPRAELARAKAADRKRRFAARKRFQPNASAIALAQIEEAFTRNDR